MESLAAFFRPAYLGPIVQPLTQDKSVINLSSTFRPHPRHLQILRKGLSFIPTPPINNQKVSLRAYLSEYHRRLKLLSHFEGRRTEVPPPFNPKSTWEPNLSSLPRELLALFLRDHSALRAAQPIPVGFNLSDMERQALEELRQNTSIIIKPADKGSAIVILDREQYVQEGLRQLQNTEYYQPLAAPIYLDTAAQIRGIVESMAQDKIISPKQSRYLIGEDAPRKRLFYLLPKIHKAPDTWPIPFKIPPGRPIVSDCGSESYSVAEFLDYYLNPLSILHKSYLKDTYDFIGKIRNIKLSAPFFIFSMDVESLYTNIDTRMGLEAVQALMDRNPDPSRPDQEIIKLLDISLSKNDFEFDNQYYLQVKGTAMGKRFAPAYANIYMATWEDTILPKCPKSPLHYYRFLDDIWGIWTHGEEEFQGFVQILNSHHPSIKIKPLSSPTSMDFLDVTTFRGPDFDITGQLDTKVFFKPTDSHALLHYSSFHPRHTFRGIVKSQLIRYKRICSRPGDCVGATRTLFRALRGRGYPRSFLRGVRKDFYKQPGPSVQRGAPKKDIAPFVAVYSPLATRVMKETRRNFEEIMAGTSLGRDTRIISSYKRNPNLRDFLVRARLSSRSVPPSSPGRCRTATNPATRATCFLKRNITRRHKNCVYKIYCRRCKIAYVGETRNSLAARLSSHRYNVRTGRKSDTLLVKHFLWHGLRNLRLVGLQHNPLWTTGERKRAERGWIVRLGAGHPNGLNEA